MKNETDNLEAYYFRTDDSGHEYFVPCELIKEVDEWLALDVTSDEFYEHPGFDHLALGRSWSDIKLWINPNDLK